MDEIAEPVRQAVMRADTMSNVQEVVETAAPKLAKYQQMGCDNSLQKIVRAYLAKLRNDLHIDNGLTNDNIRAIADRLLKEPELRWWLTIEDVALLCRKITRGDYGKFFGHFSEVEFNECFVTYCHERAEIHRLMADKVTEVAAPPCIGGCGLQDRKKWPNRGSRCREGETPAATAVPLRRKR